MLLGALTKQMEANGVLDSVDARPFYGHSVSGVLTAIRKFTTPNWVRCTSAGTASESKQHTCKLESFINEVIKGVEGEIEGLELDTV